MSLILRQGHVEKLKGIHKIVNGYVTPLVGLLDKNTEGLNWSKVFTIEDKFFFDTVDISLKL